jgi:hypothetical protein
MANNNVTTLLHLFAALGSPDEREIEDAYYKLKDFLSKPGNSQFIVANEVYPSFLLSPPAISLSPSLYSSFI